jgi:hypothetical protein
MNFSSKKTPNAPSVSGQTIGETTQNLPALADTEKSGGSAISDQRALTSAVINSTGCWMFLTGAARSWTPYRRMAGDSFPGATAAGGRCLPWLTIGSRACIRKRANGY